MRDRELNHKWKEIHRLEKEPAPRPGHRDELEKSLLVGYRNLRPQNRRWLMLLNPWNRAARFAAIGLAVLILGVGACSTSTTSEIDLGQQVTVGVPVGADIAAVDQALSKFLDSKPEIKGVSVSVYEADGGQAEFELIVWGKEIKPVQFEADLRRAVPALADSDIGIKALTGSFQESYANKLSREVFMKELDGETEAQVVARIMAELEARGLAEGATVEVRMTDDTVDIGVEIRQEELE